MTIPYALLGDCSDHQARLRSQPRSGTCRLVSTLCSKTVPTTEQIYVPNHARGLVHQSLRRARGLCRPPSTFTFPIMLGDWSTSLYAVLGDCADHGARLHSQPCSRTHQSLPALCSGLASIISDHNMGLLFSVPYELDWIILIFRPYYKAHTSPFIKLEDYIGTMHLAMHVSIRNFKMIFFLDSGTTCLRHLLPGSETKWAHFTLR